MPSKAFVNGELIKWARERAAMPHEELAKKIGQKPERLVAWETGKDQPTFKQAARLADVTHVPFGYLFLQRPPQEPLPLPDLRTVGTDPAGQLDLNTRDLINDVKFKHAWFVDHLKDHGATPLPFVGKYKVGADAVQVAADIHQTLGLAQAQRDTANWETYLRLLIDKAEAAGVWVMRTGIVANNTHRPLSVSQFRGFAISDPIAPLIFINGADAPAAQIFTFAHELAHIWLGSTGISNVQLGRTDYGTSRTTEVACNKIAAEVLVPSADFAGRWNDNLRDADNFEALARVYKVSRAVIARRALDLGVLNADAFTTFFVAEQRRWADDRERKSNEGGGGNFYNTMPLRNGARFTHAVVSRAISGETLLRDAGSLLNVRADTVVKYSKKAATR